MLTQSEINKIAYKIIVCRDNPNATFLFSRDAQNMQNLEEERALLENDLKDAGLIVRTCKTSQSGQTYHEAEVQCVSEINLSMDLKSTLEKLMFEYYQNIAAAKKKIIEKILQELGANSNNKNLILSFENESQTIFESAMRQIADTCVSYKVGANSAVNQNYVVVEINDINRLAYIMSADDEAKIDRVMFLLKKAIQKEIKESPNYNNVWILNMSSLSSEEKNFLKEAVRRLPHGTNSIYSGPRGINESVFNVTVNKDNFSAFRDEEYEHLTGVEKKRKEYWAETAERWIKRVKENITNRMSTQPDNDSWEINLPMHAVIELHENVINQLNIDYPFLNWSFRFINEGQENGRTIYTAQRKKLEVNNNYNNNNGSNNNNNISNINNYEYLKHHHNEQDNNNNNNYDYLRLYNNAKDNHSNNNNNALAAVQNPQLNLKNELNDLLDVLLNKPDQLQTKVDHIKLLENVPKEVAYIFKCIGENREKEAIESLTDYLEILEIADNQSNQVSTNRKRN